MINTQNLNAKEREEIIKSRLADYTELTDFYDIETMHTTLHIAKTDYPDKKFFTNFNGILFLSDDEDLTADFMYQTITGKSRSERHKEYLESERRFSQRERDRKIFMTKRISDLIKSGIEVLDKSLWDDWIDLVPMRVFDLYNGMDLEWFLLLHERLTDSTFEYCKAMFDKQGHSGHSASSVFMLLEKFTPNGKEFVKFLNKRG